MAGSASQSFPVERMPESEAGQEDAGMQEVDDVVMPDAEPCELILAGFFRGWGTRAWFALCPDRARREARDAGGSFVFRGQGRERKTNKNGTSAPDSIILTKEGSGHTHPIAHLFCIDAPFLTPSALRRLSPPKPISRQPHARGRSDRVQQQRGRSTNHVMIRAAPAAMPSMSYQDEDSVVGPDSTGCDCLVTSLGSEGGREG